MSAQPVSPDEQDEFWPAVVEDGIIVHAHRLSADCNVRCCVVSKVPLWPVPEGE